ncbi:MAG: MFS transporter [Parvularculaceae bacterium]
MLLVTKIVDGFSDPAMGLIADQTQSRWRKYRPYILFGAAPYGLLGVAVFLWPQFPALGKLIYAYITYTLVWLAYTAINVRYSALLGVVSPIAEERTKATQFRFIFASLGTVVIGAMATPLVEFFGGNNELIGFRTTMELFAVLSVLLFWFTFATTKERVQPVNHNSRVSKDISTLFKISFGLIGQLAGELLMNFYANDRGILDKIEAELLTRRADNNRNAGLLSV